MALAHPRHKFPDIAPVTISAWRFAITSRLSGNAEAVALVAPKVTYAAILWPGAPRLDRARGHRSQWPPSLAELEVLNDGAMLTTGSPTLRLLVDDSTRMTDLHLLEVHTVSGHPFDIPAALDALLTR